MTLVSEEKDLVDILAAMLTPTIALVGILLAVMNYRLAKKRRRDELFDRRYDFYKKLERVWRNTGNGAAPGAQPWLDWDDLEPWAQEAEFLFDSTVAEHIRSYADKEFKGLPWVPDSEFAEPFAKYLRFER